MDRPSFFCASFLAFLLAIPAIGFASPADVAEDQSSANTESTQDKKPIYKPYPRGFYIALGQSAAYRDMRNASEWRSLSSPKTFKRPTFGGLTTLDLGYQWNQQWGIQLQGAWLMTQKVTATNQSQQLSTDWFAMSIRSRLQMDKRYYFVTHIGLARANLTLKKQATAVETKTKESKWLPTMSIEIQYRLSTRWNLGLRYQLVYGSGNWHRVWDSGSHRVPSIHALGFILGYQFNQ